MAKSMRTSNIRVSSINDTKDNGIVNYNIDDILNIINNWLKSTNFTYWLIEHKADDEVSLTHFHIVIKFNTAVPFENIKSKFPYGDIESSRNIRNSVQYLIHMNDRSKVQYKWENVLTNCKDMSPFKVKSNANMEILINEVIANIEKGYIREYNQYEMIDIDIWSKHKSRIENALIYYREKKIMEKNREIVVFFISGNTGTGKTTFAKEYCQKLNKSYCISSSSNDPMQDYKGEDVLILDDLRDEDFKFSDLLKILDNHTNSTVKSRYHNKAFIGDTIFITSSKPLNDWYFSEKKENKEQLYRRIKSNYKFYEDYIELFEYSELKHKYIRLGQMKNYIKAPYSERKSITLNMLDALGLKLDEEYQNSLFDNEN